MPKQSTFFNSKTNESRFIAPIKKKLWSAIGSGPLTLKFASKGLQQQFVGLFHRDSTLGQSFKKTLYTHFNTHP